MTARSRPAHLSLLCCLFVTALVAGCGGDPGDPSVLNLALEVSPNKLDPAMVTGVAEGEICALIFSGLVRFSLEGDVMPDAARSWTLDDGGRRYTFAMDTRRRFSSGRPVTARDVIFSFERVLAPGSTSPRRWVLDRLLGAAAFSAGTVPHTAGLVAENDSTLVLTLSQPFKPFLSMLALPAAMIVSSEAVELDADDRPVGSGRWQLDTWERADFLSLSPNPHHPDTPARTVTTLRYRIIPEAFTRIAEFESGSLDILKIPSAELERFLTGERYREHIQERTEQRVLYIGLNNQREPFSDVRVRRALNLAVDVDQIIDVLAKGKGIRAGGSIPPGLAGHVDRERYQHDKIRARELLREAGFGDGFAMEIWQRDSPEGNRILEAVQGYLSEVGVRVKLVKREWSAFKESVNQGKVDAFFLDWWADYPDAENFLFPLFHSANAGGGGNRAFYHNPDVDEMIELAARTTDDDACHRLYASIDSLIYHDAPWLYLYFPKVFHAVSADVTGYTLPSLYLGADFSAVRIRRQ